MTPKPPMLERGRLLDFEVVSNHPEWHDVVLRVSDADVAIRFYHAFVGMGAVADLRDNQGKRWVQMRPQDLSGAPTLILEEIPRGREDATPIGRVSMGFKLYNRAEVDRLAAQAEREGCLILSAHDAGPFRGYTCTVMDPDKNTLEFFHPSSDRVAFNA